MNQKARDLPDLDWVELRGFARSVVEVEWLLVALALVYVYFGDFPDGSPELYVAFVTGFAASILVLRYTPALRGTPRLLIGVELALMTLFVTLLGWQTGGIHSPLINLYLLPLVTSALVFGRLTTLWLFLLLVACLFVLVTVSGGTPDRESFAALFVLLSPMALVAVLTMLLAGNIRAGRARIRDLSERDALTGQLNMHAFTRRLREEHERASHEGGRYAVVVIDVDNLRKINEEFGHETGNEAIRLVVKAIQRCTRGADTLARLGGDELMLLLPGIDRATVERVMLRIRNSVHATTFSVGRTMIRVSASLGAALYPDDAADYRELPVLAERAMHRERAERERLEAAKRPSGYAG